MEKRPQTPEDRVLWTLTRHGGSLAFNQLRRISGIRERELRAILRGLVREGRIRRGADGWDKRGGARELVNVLL